MRTKHLTLFVLATLNVGSAPAWSAESDVGALLDQANKAFGAGRREAALKLADQASQAEPNKSSSYSLRGQMLESVTRFESAIRDYSRAIELDPTVADVYDRRGGAHFKRGDIDASIRDDSGNELPLNEVGELCIRGPQVMKGYWNRPEETANVMFEGGWLRTGDMARMDEQGYIYIEDRKKDMILVSGFNVYPNEVEAYAVTHPGILEAAAIGQLHAKSGEIVKLFVVKKDPSLSEADVIEHCRTGLTGYKVPKIVEFRDDLPKTNVGKILRRALRDEEA